MSENSAALRVCMYVRLHVHTTNGELILPAIAVPTSRYNVPGFTVAIAARSELKATSTSFSDDLSTFPTRKVSLRSPWKPL